MIDDIKMALVLQRIEAAQEAATESYQKFSQLLTLIEDFYTSVDGHPFEAVEQLKEVMNKLEFMEKALCNINSIPAPRNQEKLPKWLSPWYFIVFLIMAIFGGFLGTLFHGLLFHT